MRHFPQIARATKGLAILTPIPAAAADCNNVVENEIGSAIAPFAFSIFPISSLSWRKILTIPSRLAREFCFQVRVACQHFVSIFSPHLFTSGLNFRSCFRRMFKALGWAGLLWGISSAAFANTNSRSLVVSLAPERISFTHEFLLFTVGVSAGDALISTSEISSLFVNLGAADTARDALSSFIVWHGNAYNGVNSRNNSSVSYRGIGVNLEPIQARKPQGPGAWQVQRLGGEDNNNPPTSAPRESDDIVWAAWRHADAGHKQARDNIIDEVLDISPSDVFTAAEYNIKQAAVGVSISGLEQLQNSGPEAVIDLLMSRVKNGERTMQNGITTDMYSDGTASSGKQIGGLQLLVPVNAATGTVGGINAANFSFWQNIASTVAAFTAQIGVGGAVQTMNALWVQLVRGNDGPDLIIQDNNHYTAYYMALQAQQRFQNTEAAEGGFTSLMFNNIPVILDGGVGTNCPAFTTYMLNTSYIFFRPHSARNFVPIGDDRFSVNQDAMVKLIGWAGNMTVSNRRLQGIIQSTT